MPVDSLLVRRAELLILTLVIGVGLILRLSWLDRTLLDVDEGFSWKLAQYSPAEILRRTAQDTHPPLHYLLLHAWQGVFGGSVASSRALSAACGAATVVFTFLACKVAGAWFLGLSVAHYGDTRKFSGARGSHFAWGPTFAAALVSLHFLQVSYGRNIRMYALGAMLAALTAWLLAEALRRPKAVRFWVAYALALAAFCYTHSFALLTATAQALFVAAYLLHAAVVARRAKTAEWTEEANGMAGAAIRAPVAIRATLLGFIGAAALMFLLYAPWLPALLRQRQTVWSDFWIPDVTWREFLRIVTRSFWGLDGSNPTESCVVFGLVASLLAFSLVRPTRASWFFAWHVVFVWIVVLAVSLGTTRSLFLERCLLFAQVSWLALLGVTLDRLRIWPGKLALAGMVFVPVAASSWQGWQRIPSEPPAIRSAAKLLHDCNVPGDVIVVVDILDIFRLKCYLAEAGLPRADLRGAVEPFRRGTSDELLILALDDSEAVPSYTEPGVNAPRLWLAGPNRPPALATPGYARAGEHSFHSADGTEYYLTLYVRADQARHDRR